MAVPVRYLRLDMDETTAADKYHVLSAIATEETAVYSSRHLMLRNHAVQTIIAMEITALPFLFYDLSKRGWGCHWQMAAVNEILKHNGLPEVKIPKIFWGRVRILQTYYVKYGLAHGYLKFNQRFNFWLKIYTWFLWQFWRAKMWLSVHKQR